jgi:hypothetical protein
MKTRGSRADLHLNCAGSIGWTGPEYNEHNIMNRTGTAVHDGLRTVVGGDPIPISRLIAKHRDIDQEITEIAYWSGQKIWEELGPQMPGALAEQRLEGKTTEGTADVEFIIFSGTRPRSVDEIAITDWKLGLSEDEHPTQLAAYALAAVDQYGRPTSGHVTVIEAWLMKGTYRVEKLSLEYLETLRARLQKQHAQAGKQFAAGDHCKYCPRKINCVVRDIYTRAAIDALVPPNSSRESAITRDGIAALWDKSKILEKALKEYKAAVRTEVVVNGPIDLEDGRWIDLREEEKITFHDVGTVIDEVRPYADLDQLVRISKSSLERAIKAKAPKGRGAARVRATMAQLDKQGLLSSETTLKLTTTKGDPNGRKD